MHVQEDLLAINNVAMSLYNIRLDTAQTWCWLQTLHILPAYYILTAEVSVRQCSASKVACTTATTSTSALWPHTTTGKVWPPTDGHLWPHLKTSTNQFHQGVKKEAGPCSFWVREVRAVMWSLHEARLYVHTYKRYCIIYMGLHTFIRLLLYKSLEWICVYVKHRLQQIV